MMVIVGTSYFNLLGIISTDNNSQIIKTTNPDLVMAVNNQHLVVMTETLAILTLTLPLPSLMCQALLHVMVLHSMLEEIKFFQMPTQ